MNRTLNKSKLTVHEQWTAAREIITHEDTLTHYRMTWMLQYNGFLFATVAVIVGFINNPTQVDPLSVFFVSIFGVFGCLLGFILNRSSHAQLLGAFQQLEVVTLWWNHRLKSLLPGDPSFEMLNVETLELPDTSDRDAKMKTIGQALKKHSLPPIRNWFSPRGRPRRYELPQYFQLVWIFLLGVVLINGGIRTCQLSNRMENAWEGKAIVAYTDNSVNVEMLPASDSSGQNQEPPPTPEVNPVAPTPERVSDSATALRSSADTVRRASRDTLGNSLFVVTAILMFIVSILISQKANRKEISELNEVLSTDSQQAPK